jgi:hypothetical protein
LARLPAAARVDEPELGQHIAAISGKREECEVTTSATPSPAFPDD